MGSSVLANGTEAASGTPRIVIEFPPTSADNLAEVAAITKIVNDVFIEAEEGIWNEGFIRTTEAEVTDFIHKGQLALVYLPSPETKDAVQKGQLVGCVCVKKVSDKMCTVNMLSIGKEYQGLGLGRDVFKFVEEYTLSQGCDTLGLDLLFPTTYAHPFKTRTEAWYMRLGFVQVKLGDFADDYPHLAPLLSGPCDYKVFEKKLK